MLGQHFLYANLAHAQTKQDVLELIATQFTFPAHFGKNFDALYDCMTDPLHKSGPQPGFIVVLEQIPATAKFDKEAREQLLDIFRDAADYWATARSPSAASILFCSPFCNRRPGRNGRPNQPRRAASQYRRLKSPRARRCPPTSWWMSPLACA